MEKEHIAVYLPRELAERLDAVATTELRSRTNATRWLLEQALREREPALHDDKGEAS
jgi:metal-responsive CopG/Arc/MetJ family transcriptional regulator